MKKVDLYTDGACSNNPGPGGWGVVLIYKGIKKEFSGFVKETTNNRMELMAVIKGLSFLKEQCDVTVQTDSAYVFNAFDKNWITSWQEKNWINSQKDEVANKDLWQKLLKLTQNHKVTWKKVKGHSTNEFNNLCDKIATDQIKKHAKKINKKIV